jgi:hypothetical protein
MTLIQLLDMLPKLARRAPLSDSTAGELLVAATILSGGVGALWLHRFV